MKNKNIKNFLIIFNIILLIFIIYENFFNNKLQEGAIVSGIVAIATAIGKAIVWAGKGLYAILIPCAECYIMWAIFVAGITADIVPQIVKGSKKKGERMREEKAQLNGVNNVSYVRTYVNDGITQPRKKNDPEIEFTKVPSFKCVDKKKNIDNSRNNSDCNNFVCDLHYEKTSGKYIVPPNIADKWVKHDGKMYTTKNNYNSKGRWSRLVECYLSTYGQQEENNSKKETEERFKKLDNLVKYLPKYIDKKTKIQEADLDIEDSLSEDTLRDIINESTDDSNYVNINENENDIENVNTNVPTQTTPISNYNLEKRVNIREQTMNKIRQIQNENV